MAKFRKEIKSDFTTVHNAFIKDKSIFNGAKGLLLEMLQLPDDWNFSIKGLSSICKDGEHRISSQLHELEQAGYVVRHRIQADDGTFWDWEYIISDEPLPEDIRELGHNYKKSENDTGKSTNDVNTTSSPDCGFPELDNPHLENRDIYKIKKDKIKKNKIYSVCQSSHNLKLTQENENDFQIRDDMTDKAEDNNLSELFAIGEPNSDDTQPVVLSREKLKENIGYKKLIHDKPEYSGQINAIVDIITAAMSDSNNTVRISKSNITKDIAAERFSRLTGNHILYVIDRLNSLIRDKPENKPKNPKSYVLTMLYNAPIEYEQNHVEIFSRAAPEISFDLDEYKALANYFV